MDKVMDTIPVCSQSILTFRQSSSKIRGHTLATNTTVTQAIQKCTPARSKPNWDFFSVMPMSVGDRLAGTAILTREAVRSQNDETWKRWSRKCARGFEICALLLLEYVKQHFNRAAKS